jgi:hypothetical protein
VVPTQTTTATDNKDDGQQQGTELEIHESDFKKLQVRIKLLVLGILVLALEILVPEDGFSRGETKINNLSHNVM